MGSAPYGEHYPSPDASTVSLRPAGRMLDGPNRANANRVARSVVALNVWNDHDDVDRALVALR